ncbi:MAG TPA: VWA domain-containing protein [Terriglobia bacterium]|nr:VWA domain-containing protein [Terriglobia bacterium]
MAHTTNPPPVQICVVVRNARGDAVDNLRQSDFRLWDNNRLQRINDFAGNTVAEPVRDLKEPGTIRYTALYFDDLHYDFTDTIRVTDSAYAFFKSMLGPRSKVGVFTASGEITLNFTDDREKLHQTLLAIKPHIASGTQAQTCPPLTDFQSLMLLYGSDPLALRIALDDMNACSTPSGREDPPASSLPMATLKKMTKSINARARQVIAESEVQSQKTLDGLNRLITRVSTLPDPRSIIVASPGFLAGSQARQVDVLARRATRLHIIISALDVTGLIRQLPAPAPTQSRKLDEEREAIVAGKNQMMADRASMAADVLLDLATMTGGNFIGNKDDLESGFRAAIPLPPAYYVLGYSPTVSKDDGRFHDVRIRVVRHGLVGIQAPSGYYAPGTAAEIARSSVRDRHSKHRRK